MAKIQIFDTTLRDGEQTPGVNLYNSEKLQIAKQLEKLGVDIIEAGFPITSQGDFKSVQDISGVIKNSTIAALARLKKADIDAAYEATKNAAHPRLHTFIATSDIHLKYKLKMSREEVLEGIKQIVAYGRNLFAEVEFSAEDATRTDKEYLVQVIETAINAGAKVINVPDTVGFTHPVEFGNLFKYLKQSVSTFDKAIFSCHCHDDLGMAVANSLAAVENGALQVECAINGIGERAGNASLEEVALALYTRKDYYQHEISLNLSQINDTCQMVSQLTGLSIAKNKSIVGANVYSHESGIHQDGVLKNPTTYEIIDPVVVGVARNRLVLGKHSGSHAFYEHMKDLGYELDENQKETLFKEFKKLTDTKKEISDEDLRALMAEQTTKEALPYDVFRMLLSVDSNAANQKAEIKIKDPKGNILEASAEGSGSIEAIYKAIDKVFTIKTSLKDYSIQAITNGPDALGRVRVEVEYDGGIYIGNGVSQDVLEASAKAYVYALGKATEAEKKKKEC